MKRQTKNGQWHEFTSDEEAQRTYLLDCGATTQDVNDYVMCDRAHAQAKAEGRLYYDYERQCWVNENR